MSFVQDSILAFSRQSPSSGHGALQRFDMSFYGGATYSVRHCHVSVSKKVLLLHITKSELNFGLSQLLLHFQFRTLLAWSRDLYYIRLLALHSSNPSSFCPEMYKIKE